MMKKRNFLWLFAVLAIFLLFYAGTANAVSMSGGRNNNFRFVPNQDIVLVYELWNIYDYPLEAIISPSLDPSYSSPEIAAEDAQKIMKNIVITPSRVTIQPQTRQKVTARIKMPAELEEPGTHVIFMQATEAVPGGGMVGATAAIRKPVYIEVLHPDVYLVVKLSANNIKENEIVNFTIDLTNKGKKPALNVYADITIYDPLNKTIGVLRTNSIDTINSFESGTLKGSWNSAGKPPGKYRWTADIYYSGTMIQRESFFRIGTLFVEIIDFTRTAIQGKINPFNVNVESNWNEQLDIYANVDIKTRDRHNIANFNTISYKLFPFSIMNLSGYFDTTAIGLGEYDAKVTLFYAGTTTVKTGKISVVPNLSSLLSINWWWLLLLLLLIIINVLLIMLLKKKDKDDKNEKQEKKENVISSSINDLIGKLKLNTPKKKKEEKGDEQKPKDDEKVNKGVDSDLFDIFGKK